jgi:hypothetical protein
MALDPELLRDAPEVYTKHRGTLTAREVWRVQEILAQRFLASRGVVRVPVQRRGRATPIAVQFRYARLASLILLLSLCSATLAAQPPLTLAWTQVDATPAEAQTFLYRVYLDAASPFVLSGVTCTLLTGVTDCSAPLPAPSIGTHTLQLTGENAYGESERSAALTFKYPAVPTAPTMLRILKGS